MIDGPFRERLPKLTPRLTAFYASRGWTPNQITVGAFVLSCVAASLVAVGWTWPAIAVWWLGRLLDGTDGIYARETGRTSDFGGYLDILLDMASYGVMIAGFYFWRTELAGLWLAILFLYVLCITSALALGGLERGRGMEATSDNRSLRLSAGLAEGGETGIAYTIFLLFPDGLRLWAMLWIVVLMMTVAARTLLARKIL